MSYTKHGGGSRTKNNKTDKNKHNQVLKQKNSLSQKRKENIYFSTESDNEDDFEKALEWLKVEAARQEIHLQESMLNEDKNNAKKYEPLLSDSENNSEDVDKIVFSSQHKKMSSPPEESYFQQLIVNNGRINSNEHIDLPADSEKYSESAHAMTDNLNSSSEQLKMGRARRERFLQESSLKNERINSKKYTDLPSDSESCSEDFDEILNKIKFPLNKNDKSNITELLNCSLDLNRRKNEFLANLNEDNKEKIFMSFDDFISDAFSFLKKHDMSLKKDSIIFIMRHFFSSMSDFSKKQKENIILLNEAILAINDEFLFSESNVCKNRLIDSYVHDKVTIMKNSIFFIANNALTGNDDDYDIEFFDGKKAGWINFFKKTFNTIEMAVASRSDYKKINNFSDTMKNIVWVFCSYLIGFTRRTTKHDRDQDVEELLEKFYQKYGELEYSEKNCSSEFMMQKINDIENLLNEFSTKVGRSTVHSMVHDAFKKLANLKKIIKQGVNIEQKNGVASLPKERINAPFFNTNDINQQEGKLIEARYKFDRPLNELVKMKYLKNDLQLVPFEHIKNKRKEFKDSFVNN
ncbi:MAG: hypothetical protein K2Q14_03415 [Gammaproteobacteria bacterium]|nr:hypothetical protein [Gammaproteobacteria bacterium]